VRGHWIVFRQVSFTVHLLKIRQAFSFSDSYLKAFYEGRSGKAESFAETQQALFRDGFSAIHFFTQDMPGLGYETFISVINDEVSQKAWMEENAPHLKDANVPAPKVGLHARWLDKQFINIFIEQINAFDPDVLYLDDPIAFDSQFIRLLKRRPRLVIGWRAASVPKDTDWRDIDLIVSNHTPSLELGRKHGARWQERFMPGFPVWIGEEVAREKLVEDVSFTGSLSFEHARRMRILEELGAKAEEQNFHLAYFAEPKKDLPPQIAKHIRGAVWGMEMYRSMARSRINLNIHIDLAGNEAANMRLFEATGVGAFLLTDAKPNLANFFEPGREIETFRSSEELAEKIRYYLDHEEERAAIARRGRAKCLAHFTRDKAAAQLDAIIRRALRAKGTRQSLVSRWAERLQPGLHPIPQ